jgi:hypothetical protein
MNKERERQEFQQYLKDWELRMRSIPGHPELKKEKGGELFGKLWSIFKTFLESLGDMF